MVSRIRLKSDAETQGPTNNFVTRMKCPACRSEIADGAYRCKECWRICSYKRLCYRYRYVLLIILALVGFWVSKTVTRRVLTADFARLPEGALVSDSMTRSTLR